jgi:hypothetical protein
MLPKSVITCLAATALATGLLMPTVASAANNGRQPGTYMWPPHTEGPQTTCGYVWVYRHKPGKGQWAYQCH